MEKESPQKEGLVGIFDILGYQYIIDNNQINCVADLISKTLLDLPQKGVDKFLSSFKNTKIADFSSEVISRALKWRIFSDTILFSFPFTERENPKFTSIDYLFFLNYISHLLRFAFDAGLPLRGAIDCGEYYIKENCFAGKPIIDSYRLSQKLQISGCAMAKSFQKLFSAHMKNDNSFKRVTSLFVQPYIVPLKKKNTRRLYIIDWSFPVPVWKTPLDLRQYVTEKFSSHNKIIPREALPKLINTEMTLRYFLSKREGKADRL